MLHNNNLVTFFSLLRKSDNFLPFCFFRNPLEVTEEFIELFNSADNFLTKEKYEDQARKLLERSKVSWKKINIFVRMIVICFVVSIYKEIYWL